MSWGLFIDLLVDRVKSSGVPIRKGASLAITDRQVDRLELVQLIRQHDEAWQNFPYQTGDDRLGLACEMLDIAGPSHSSSFLAHFAPTLQSLIEMEPGFLPFTPPENLSILSPLQMGKHARDLHYRIVFLSDQSIREATFEILLRLMRGFFDRLFPSVTKGNQSDAQALITETLFLLDKPYEFMTDLLSHFLNNNDIHDHELFRSLNRQLYGNALEASGVIIDPDLPLYAHDARKSVLPGDCAREPLKNVADRYFQNTPLLDLLKTPVPFTIPQETRFEHMHILAGTGHGKTQTLQHLIVSDLQRPLDEIPSMVILDSQGDMLNTLKRLSLFDPMIEGSLARRLLIVDPSDVEFAPSLNLFDIQSERLKDYSQKDREQVLAGIIEIYDYIFGGLLGAELTQKQGMVFRFLAQLMLSIPEATIHTLRDLLIDASPYMEYVEKLPDTARGFFETQFFQHGYKATREQILRRLYGVLQNPSFERMFASPQNRLDLFDVLNEGGIVLVNTAKDFMKSDASSMFGRYIIALTFKAAMERAILPHQMRRPTFLWIDEASEYFDDNIDSLLIQARKYKLGLIMAHQYLGQLPKGLTASIMTNTSIKLAGGLSDRDARELARDMRTSPEFVSGMTKQRNHTNFAAFVRNVTPQAMKLSIPFGTAERMDKMPDEHFEILLNASRRRLSPEPIEPSPQEPMTDATKTTTPTIPLPDDDEFWQPY